MTIKGKVAFWVIGWGIMASFLVTSLASDIKFNLKTDLTYKGKGWTKVTDHAVLMSQNLAQLCAAPIPQKVTQPDNPHLDKFFHVYVNDIGRKAMMTEKAPKFPVGSIIIKEKLTDASEKNVELLTVMVKHQAGFDANNGDWDYLVLNSQGQPISTKTKLESCQNCHRDKKAQDYIFRNYLSIE